MTANKHTKYEVIRIFIGSPGDVPKERILFPKIVKRVNRLKANSMGVHLEPVGWEDTLPGKGQPRVQSKINKDLLKCDLIVMLLWNRWGSKTGKYSSGFEEEYKVAKSKGKGIWFFFREIHKEMLADPGKQLEKVIMFRDSIERAGKYFYKRYKNEKDWKIKLEEYLCDWLDDIGPAPPPGKLPETPPGFQGLQDATEYITGLSKLKAEADGYIAKQIKTAHELASQANDYANQGRISKAEEYYAKALSISNEPSIVHNFGVFLHRIGELDRANEKFDLLMEIAETTNDDKLKSIALTNQGLIQALRGDYVEAERRYHKALKIYKEIGDKDGMAGIYGNLANIKWRLNKPKEAEKLVTKALEINKESGNEWGMAKQYGNLGILKGMQGETEEAESLHEKALKLNIKLGRKEGISKQYGNLGIIKAANGKHEEAEKLHKKALEIDIELSDKEGMAATYGNLGNTKREQGEPEEAEKFYKKALKLNIELDNKYGIASLYYNLGLLKETLEDLDEAEKLYNKSLEINNELGITEKMPERYGNLGNIKQRQGELEKAKKLYKISLKLFHSIGNTEQIGILNKIIVLKSPLSCLT